MLPSHSISAEQRARLQLLIDKKRAGEINVVFRGNDIFTRVSDLEAARIDLSGGRVETIHGVQHVSLKSLVRQLSFKLDETDLSLQFTLENAPVISPGLFKAPMIGSEASPAETPVKREIASSRELKARLMLNVNGVKKGEIAAVVRGSDVLVRVNDIQALGLHTDSAQVETITGDGFVSLKSLSSQFVFELDERDLSLRLTTRPSVKKSPMADPNALAHELAIRPDVKPEGELDKTTDQRAIFSVRVNEIKTGETDVILRGDDVLIRVKDLRNAGMLAVNGRQQIFRGESYVSLKSLAPSVSYRIDENSLTIDLTLTPEAFGENILSGTDNRPKKMEYSEATSGFVNYAVNATDFKSVNAFSEVGVTIKNALLYSSAATNPDGSIARGFSNLTINNRDSINRVVLGDRLVNTDFLGGSATLGGLSYFRDFALDPYFIRNPGLNYSGAVSTPSTVDVYSHGRLIRRMSLPAGQFQLQDLPVPVGVNDTRVIIRDAFGRERELGSEVFYFTSGLLKPGLHDFSYNLGAERSYLGVKNWSYAEPMFLGYHRYGFSDYLTAGFRLEAAARGLVSGGPNFSFSVPFGEMEFVSAASTEGGISGGAAFLGYNYINRQFSFSSSLKLQSEHYATTSLAANERRSWLAAGVYTALPLSDWMSFNFRYSMENQRGQGLLHHVGVFGNTRLGKRLSLLTGVTLDLKGGERSLGFNFGLNVNLGEVNASLSYRYDDGVGAGVMDVRKTLPTGPGYGYGLQVDTVGDLDSIFQYQNDFGRYEANYSRLEGHQRSELRAAGGLAYIDGHLRFTRPIQDAFALIKVDGLSGIRGYLNNLEIGKTDSKGRLFVPDLLSYYGNNLGISRKDLPLNYNIDEVNKIVAAPYRGGVLVDFPVKQIQRIVGKAIIVSGDKTFVPKHGQLTILIPGKSLESPLGNNGEFYFENLKTGRFQAQIEIADQVCDFSLEVPESNDDVIELPIQRCQMPLQ
jgi:outer membrane usher protein